MLLRQLLQLAVLGGRLWGTGCERLCAQQRAKHTARAGARTAHSLSFFSAFTSRRRLPERSRQASSLARMRPPLPAPRRREPKPPCRRKRGCTRVSIVRWGAGGQVRSRAHGAAWAEESVSPQRTLPPARGSTSVHAGSAPSWATSSRSAAERLCRSAVPATRRTASRGRPRAAAAAVTTSAQDTDGTRPKASTRVWPSKSRSSSCACFTILRGGAANFVAGVHGGILVRLRAYDSAAQTHVMSSAAHQQWMAARPLPGAVPRRGGSCKAACSAAAAPRRPHASSLCVSRHRSGLGRGAVLVRACPRRQPGLGKWRLSPKVRASHSRRPRLALLAPTGCCCR